MTQNLERNLPDLETKKGGINTPLLVNIIDGLV